MQIKIEMLKVKNEAYLDYSLLLSKYKEIIDKVHQIEKEKIHSNNISVDEAAS
jgi:hypothetical protein